MKKSCLLNHLFWSGKSTVRILHYKQHEEQTNTIFTHPKLKTVLAFIHQQPDMCVQVSEGKQCQLPLLNHSCS